VTIPALRVKPGVTFATISPGGFVMLAALWRTSQSLGHDVTITSATDGAHSGDNDPHHLGRAYDVRTQGFAGAKMLSTIMNELRDNTNDKVIPVAGGFVTRHFFGWIEEVAAPNEHIHLQVRRGITYPPDDPTITA